ncbi:MAG: hypothetical protein ABF483_02430 [Liquorilactobacillus nagelii]|jgi:DNA mismatch repair ATPase MutS|uniref:DNA mismatch repair proteins mutS family domain-containing protein n=4 Tax=Lactobacillaceae TaxID=33958 RepID=A0A3Q8CPV5_9LACO|nr:hypothetical protein [Liquorilactobacillus nagelii]AUJ32892.1 hypothetical protein BSQ50_10295 [Liquorilactobacillus nagelii]MCC7616361.1 hypothetical protein [Liquorilactobacillus nagelii]MCP9315121.1 hypothetical protein [Liquorilactobacillus nagelii]
MKVQLIDLTDTFATPFKLTQIQQLTYQELELEPVLSVMAKNDEHIQQAVLTGWFTSMLPTEQLKYRQATIRDALSNAKLIQELYQLSDTTILQVIDEGWGLLMGSASYQVSSKANLIKIFLQAIEKIQAQAANNWQSTAFKHFFQRLAQTFSQEKLKQMYQVIASLGDYSPSYAFSTNLFDGLQGKMSELDYYTKQTRATQFFKGVQMQLSTNFVSFVIGDRDDNSSQALGRYENRAMWGLATEVSNTFNELRHFFNELRAQLAFMQGVINLKQALPENTPLSFAEYSLEIKIVDLRNVVLLLNHPARDVVGNSFTSNRKPLWIISGANQGGKTTTLRSLGQAQLMGQSGMFVAAQSFNCNKFKQVVTHFKREEDTQLNTGKLAEELQRMQRIIANLQQPALILMNESFSSTNEHEGSIINSQIMAGLVNSGVTLIAVTHQYEFSKMFASYSKITPLYFRAERQADGQRSFKIIPGQPRETSYGLDIFNRFFAPKTNEKTTGDDIEESN